MARTDVLDTKRLGLSTGGNIPTVILALPVGTADVELTFTVDDPLADPPTDAKVMLIVEADDGVSGARWYPISHCWGGTSGTLKSWVPVRGRRIRVRGRADAGCTVDILATAV